MGVHYCNENKTLYVADTYNHKIKTIENPASDRPLVTWAGTISENQKVADGKDGLLNEPSGLWALVINGNFEGLYVADTGNDCIRLISSAGCITTPDLRDIPDVRESASDCIDGQCVP